jgi:orotidine-5'-phosphate decarboxylase
METLTAEFWNEKYLNQQTGWDLGEVSPPIKTYIDQITNKDLRILIPGAGHAYEANYLLENGFTLMLL